MDKLSFKIFNVNTIQQKVALPFINDKSLVDIIKEIEQKWDSKIAGAYDGIRPIFLYEELSEKSSFFHNSKPRILECDCGTDGCWSLLIEIKENESTIEWLNFEQIFRDNWNYNLHFEFDKKEYENAINKLKIGK